MTLIGWTINKWTRVSARAPNGHIAAGLNVWNRRSRPNPQQFSGTVTVGTPPAAAARVVQLRLRGGTLLETTTSDASTGAFRFIGWYPVRSDYEIHVIGDGFVNRSFPVSDPIALQWNGNPEVIDSTP